MNRYERQDPTGQITHTYAAEVENTATSAQWAAIGPYTLIVTDITEIYELDTVHMLRRSRYPNADAYVEAMYDYSVRGDRSKLDAYWTAITAVKKQFPLPTADDIANEAGWWARMKGWLGLS